MIIFIFDREKIALNLMICTELSEKPPKEEQKTAREIHTYLGNLCTATQSNYVQERKYSRKKGKKPTIKRFCYEVQVTDSEFSSSMEGHQLHKKQIKCSRSVSPNHFGY